MFNFRERLSGPGGKLGRLFYSYLSMLLVPILISSAAYVSIERMVRRQSLRIAQTAIEQTGAALDHALQEAETLASALLSNRHVHTCANAQRPTSASSIYDLLEMSYDLRSYSLGLSGISDFFLYFPGSDLVMTRMAAYSPTLFYENLYRSPALSYENFYQEVLGGYYHGSILDIRFQRYGRSQEFLVYAISLPGSEAGSTKANIFLLIDTALLQNTFCSFEEIAPGSKAVIASSLTGQPLFSFSSLENTEEAVRDEFLEGRYRESGYLHSRFSSKTGLGLDYIIWQPERAVLEPVRRIRNFMLAAIALYVLLGVGMSFILSERTHAPIRSLFGSIQPLLRMSAASSRRDYRLDLKAIEEGVFHLAAQSASDAQQLAEMLPVVRNNLLNELLSGGWEEQAPGKLMEQYGLQLEGPWFFVIIFELDTVAEEKLSAGLAAAAEAACAHGALFDRCYCAEPASRQLCLIASHQGEVGDEEILCLANRIRDDLFYLQNLDVSAYTGTCGEGLSSIARSYHEAMQALYYRAVIPGSSVVEYRSLSHSISLIRFGTEAEFSLRSALREGNADKAQYWIDQLFEENALRREVDPYMAHCLVIRLLLTLAEAGEGVGFGLYGDPGLQPAIRGLFPLEARMEQSSDTLKEIARQLCRYVREHQDKTLKGLRNRAEEIIAQQIANPELSQTYLAQRLGVSAPYLSAFFKEKLGQNMVDYINRRRCELARSYLSGTDWTLSEIADRVGLADSAAVIRIFKKYYGMTPGQYRKQFGQAQQ